MRRATRSTLILLGAVSALALDRPAHAQVVNHGDGNFTVSGTFVPNPPYVASGGSDSTPEIVVDGTTDINYTSGGNYFFRIDADGYVVTVEDGAAILNNGYTALFVSTVAGSRTVYNIAGELQSNTSIVSAFAVGSPAWEITLSGTLRNPTINSVLLGQDGADRLIMQAGSMIQSGNGHIELRGGADELIFNGGTFDGLSQIDFGAGDDLLELNASPVGAPAMLGGDGSDTVRLNNSGSFSLTALKSGWENLEMEGTAWTLSGSTANSFSGGIGIVGAGTLTLDITGGDQTIEGVIKGDGRLVKSGEGMLTLSGFNTYRGGTTINGGVIQVSDDANLGDASGVLTFGGGTLRNTAAFSTARDVTLNTGGTFQTDADLTASGVISGSGGIIKTGAGTLTLTGANNYAGGTRVDAGTLAGDAASIRGDIANDGIVVFVQAADATFSGDITGAGVMEKDSAGTLILAGTSMLDWTIRGGGLATVAERFAGDIAIGSGATFNFDQVADADYAGVISGTGSFVKSGTGLLRLSGDSSAFAGATIIQGGALLIGNEGVGTLGGSLLVQSGGLLGGTGTLGSAASTITIGPGGVHAPGNSIGTQTIAGDYVNHGTLRIEGTPGKADKLVVMGSVDISGSTLDLLLSPVEAAAWPIANGPFTLIDKQSVGSVGGTFGTVNGNLLFLTPTLDYAGGDGNDVTLELSRNEVAFAAVGRTRNQIATGEAVDRLPGTNPVWNALALSTDEDEVRAAFDLLSGEIHASARAALIEDSVHIRNAVSDRIGAAFKGVDAASVPVLAYGPGGPALAPADTDRFAAWGRAFGSWGFFDDSNDAASLDHSTAGILVGADGQAFDNWRLGLIAGYSHSSFDAKDRGSSGSSDNYHLGVYGGAQWGQLGFRSGLAYSWHDIETDRSIAFPGFRDQLTAGYDAATAQVFTELGYRIDRDGFGFEPFANLAYVNVHTDGFREEGGDAALASRSSDSDTTFITLGLRAAADFNVGGIKTTARGMLGWRHAFGDGTPIALNAFAGGDAFDIAGVPIARDAVVIEGGFDLAIAPDAALGLSYSGQIASGARGHGVKADFTMKF
ncbi:autotransporter outer membrane beta-barrel domain-containing protein [Mesorhizobium sp. 1B3]|uniref:autotransporter outer membrane beta-barrel domain-containing protein n=1 Tax=Mesorhizobium sp. 1B3 TaxID=3243599 RepID=UPI003D97C464